MCSPELASAWMADSRPEPGPWTSTDTRLTPAATASRPATSAATVAANGVDFLEPLKPALPALDHTIALPWLSAIVISVLLKVALMCATPSASTARLRAFGRAAAVAGLLGPLEAPVLGVVGLATLVLPRFLWCQQRGCGQPGGPGGSALPRFHLWARRIPMIRA